MHGKFKPHDVATRKSKLLTHQKRCSKDVAHKSHCVNLLNFRQQVYVMFDQIYFSQIVTDQTILFFLKTFVHFTDSLIP